MTYFIAYLLIVFILWCLIAYMHGREDIAGEDEGAIVVLAVMAVIWPLSLVVAVFVVFFTFLGELGQKHRVKS